MTRLILASSPIVGLIFGLGVRNAVTLPAADLEPALTGGILAAFLIASAVVAYVESWGRP